MIGKELYRYGSEAVGGIAARDKKRYWECLDDAALEFCRDTGVYMKQAVLTTVAGQREYLLPADFIEMVTNRPPGLRQVAKYRDSGGTETYPIHTTFEKIFDSTETSKTRPSAFAVLWVAQSQPPEVSGTSASWSGAESGETTLTDSSATFVTDGVSARDTLYNAGTGATGPVLSVASETELTAALFHGHEPNLSANDAYTIYPAVRPALWLDAPSESSGDTITVTYSARPAPVFSDKSRWMLDASYCRAIAFRAAVLFMADIDPNRERDEGLMREFREATDRARSLRARQALQGGLGRYRWQA